MAAVASNKRKREASDLHTMRAAPGLQASGDFEGYLQSQHDMDGSDTNMDFASILAQHEAESEAAEQGHNHTSDQSQPVGQSQGGSGNGANASDTATAALAQYHTMTVPQPTEQAFLAQHGESSEHRGSIDQASSAGPHRASFGEYDGARDGQNAATNGDSSSPPNNATSETPTSEKPVVGSEAWHKVRRDNHKEVERRRRETINEGINELAKIVPGCERNKGSILARAVQFITQLKENETANIEKWTLEKLLTEQALAELSSSCDKLKAECQRAWAECERWKKAATKAGASTDTEEKPTTTTQESNAE